MEKSQTHTAAKLMSALRRTLTAMAYLLLNAALLLPVASQAEALQDFEAVYRIEKYGNIVGLASYQLKQDGAQAHFSMRTKLTGIAALFRNDRVEEDSWLEQKNGVLQLQRYHYQKLGSKHARTTEYKIEWADDNTKGSASGSHADTPVSIPVEANVRDALSFQLSLMQDVAVENSVMDYQVLSKDELKRYDFRRVGQENLSINNRAINTLIVERKQGDRLTRLWLASEFQYVPVKIELFENDESDSRMLINSVSVGGKLVLE